MNKTKVGIVGAGLAGLVCADELRKNGIRSTVFDANTRTGGRCWSLRNYFPGQVAERGGEFIDTPHKTLLAYIREFGLAVEDVDKEPGEVFYFFNGQHCPEAAVVDEYRDFVAAMRDDLRRLSNEPTADAHTDFDVALDSLSLAEYLATRGAPRRCSKPFLNRLTKPNMGWRSHSRAVSTFFFSSMRTGARSLLPLAFLATNVITSSMAMIESLRV